MIPVAEPRVLKQAAPYRERFITGLQGGEGRDGPWNDRVEPRLAAAAVQSESGLARLQLERELGSQL